MKISSKSHKTCDESQIRFPATMKVFSCNHKVSLGKVLSHFTDGIVQYCKNHFKTFTERS